ncbi:MAG: ribonuclease PH [Chloroflexota bacterium]
MYRADGRKPDELRPVSLVPDFVVYPEGSVLIAMGETRVLCNVTVQEGVPGWMRGQGLSGGWITAEYALLPRSTHHRTPRETFGLRGRTQEIRRLIGRCLRAAVDQEKLGERTCIVDCDVIQADGGTRSAAITGGYVALALALGRLIQGGLLPPEVLTSAVAAISVGVVNGQPLLDLCYEEDSTAEVDVNVVMNADGRFIEVQGSAEGAPFPRTTLHELLDLAHSGIDQLLTIQREMLDQRRAPFTP